MGRAFEFRKARKMKRWGQMSKSFTKFGKMISVAVKSGGAAMENNALLRVVVQNAKAANMPKDNIERAIKKAADKGSGDNFKEIVYEGYGPHGIAFVIETTTDNHTRTVANIRLSFNRCGGSLGTTGSNEFMFERKCMFRVKKPAGFVLDDFELELIDYGGDEINEDGNEISIYGDFQSFGALQKFFEAKGLEITNAGLERIPHELKELTSAQQEEVEKLIEKLEEDEDVQNVFHNMA